MKPGWRETHLPEELTYENDLGDILRGDAQVPLMCVAFHEVVPIPGTDERMATTWRAHGVTRIMEVVKKIFSGKRGLTTSDRPTLVLHATMVGRKLGELPPLPHGIGSTRLMAAHLAMAALMTLSTEKDYSEVPEVKVAAVFLGKPSPTPPLPRGPGS